MHLIKCEEPEKAKRVLLEIAARLRGTLRAVKCWWLEGLKTLESACCRTFFEESSRAHTNVVGAELIFTISFEGGDVKEKSA